MVMSREERNALTANGRFTLQPGVTAAKVAKMKELVEDTLGGSAIARGHLEEVLTTSDALFSYATLTNINFLPEFDRAPRTWTEIAGKRSVPNFHKPVLYSIVSAWQGLGFEGADPTIAASQQPEGVMPIIPEGAPYPYASMSGEEAIAGGLNKRGFKTDFTFEAFINDQIGFIQALPGEMLRIALDTEDYDIYGALLGGGVGTISQLAGGTTPSGTTVPANSALTREALVEAKKELSLRLISGRQVEVRGGYNLLVPIGQALNVNYFLNATYLTQNPGSTAGISFDVSGYNPLADITVIESRWLSGTQWFLVPKPGATARPILDHLTLIGHETPELRVENVQGTYVGGGAVSPFEGNFANDSATFRIRNIGGSVLWTPALLVFSRGDNGAVA